MGPDSNPLHSYLKALFTTLARLASLRVRNVGIVVQRRQQLRDISMEIHSHN
jgi:hypothetical protein